jgi:hypothetical protein
MLDIALASGRGGTINHDAICGLLTKCLQDVSFAILKVSYLFGHCGSSLFLAFVSRL